MLWYYLPRSIPVSSYSDPKNKNPKKREFQNGIKLSQNWFFFILPDLINRMPETAGW